MSDQTVTIAVTVDDLAAPELKRIRKQTEDVGKAFERTGKRIERGRDELGKFVKGAGKGYDSVGGGLKTALATVGFDRFADAAIGAATAVARNFVNGIKAAVRANAELQQSIQNAVAISGGSYADLEEAAVSAGMAAAFSAKEAGDALGFLAQAGFNAADAAQALPGVLDLASAGSLELARAADIASNALSGFGLGVDELGRVNDVLAQTAASSNTNVEQLGHALKQVAPLAVASSQSLESVSAAIGILGNAGIQATQAGTMLRGALGALQKPSGEAAAVIESLGVKVLDAEGQMRPLIDIIRELGAAGATNADLLTIFGRETIAGVAALSQATDQWADATRKATDESKGFAKEVANLKLDTLSGQYQILTGSVDTYAARVGQTLNPGLMEAARATNAVLAESTLLNAELATLSAVVGANTDAFSNLAASGLVVVATTAKSAFDSISALVGAMSRTVDVASEAAKFVGLADESFGSFADKAEMAGDAVQVFGHGVIGLLTVFAPLPALLAHGALYFADIGNNAREAAEEIERIDSERRMRQVAQDTQTAAETFEGFVDALKEYPSLIAKGVEETIKQRIEEERVAEIRKRNSQAALQADIRAAKAKDPVDKLRAQREAAIARVKAQALESATEALKIERVSAEFTDKIAKAVATRAKQEAAARKEAERKAEAEAQARLDIIERNALAEYQLDVLRAQTETERVHAEYALELQRIEQAKLTELERQVALREAEVQRNEDLRALETEAVELARQQRVEREMEADAAARLSDSMHGVADAISGVSTGLGEVDALSRSLAGLLDVSDQLAAAEQKRTSASIAQIFGESDARQQELEAKEASTKAEVARAQAISATGQAIAGAAGALGANAQQEAAILAVFEAAAAASAFGAGLVFKDPSMFAAAGQHAFAAATYGIVAGTTPPTSPGASTGGGASAASSPSASASGGAGVDTERFAQIQAEALADVLEDRRSGDTVINVTVRDSVMSSEKQVVDLLNRGVRQSSLGRRLVPR